MIRSCTIPNEEFRVIDTNDVESACKKFYILYEKCYGQINCTYSIHVTGSHLLPIRGNRPLTYKSAFKFESFFSEMRELFHAGSVSPTKQILQNCYMKRILEHHVCQKSTFFKPEKQPVQGKKFTPAKENNSLVYIFNENQTYTFYCIKEIVDQDNFQCYVQVKFPVKMPLTPEYNWSKVGVFKAGPISEELHVIKRKDICGKVIKVNKFLITCPNNVLHEQ